MAIQTTILKKVHYIIAVITLNTWNFQFLKTRNVSHTERLLFGSHETMSPTYNFPTSVPNTLFQLQDCLYRCMATDYTIPVRTTVLLKMNPRVRKM
jgi:hypothetical protein